MAKQKTWPIKVGVLHHKHGVDIFSGWNEKEVLARVYDYVKEWWDDYCDDQDLPEDHETAIAAYFEAAGGEEYLDTMGDFLPAKRV